LFIYEHTADSKNVQRFEKGKRNPIPNIEKETLKTFGGRGALFGGCCILFPSILHKGK